MRIDNRSDNIIEILTINSNSRQIRRGYLGSELGGKSYFSRFALNGRERWERCPLCFPESNSGHRLTRIDRINQLFRESQSIAIRYWQSPAIRTRLNDLEPFLVHVNAFFYQTTHILYTECRRARTSIYLRIYLFIILQTLNLVFSWKNTGFQVCLRDSSPRSYRPEFRSGEYVFVKQSWVRRQPDLSAGRI